MTEKNYRAVFFDMDGTLLGMEIEEFLHAYFKDIAGFVARRGKNVDAFLAGFKAGTVAMGAHDGTLTNADAFWNEFFRHVDGVRDEWIPMLDEYYETEFGKVGEGVQVNPAAARAVNTLAEKGYPLVLATQPMFPEGAVLWRLRWAGVDAAPFVRMTRYDNSTAVKPKLAYYAENLAACGLRGEDVLMVGNNTIDDLSCAGLGADVHLVTDHLLNPANIDMNTVRHSTMEEFANWTETLPSCEAPATTVNAGLVAAAARDAAYAENVLPGVSDDAPLFAAEQSSIDEGMR